MDNDLTPHERAIILRAHLASPGYLMGDRAIADKLEQVKAQAFLMPDERSPDYKSWSIDRISGMVLGLGYARTLLPMWMEKFDAMERAAAEQKESEEGVGHPYREET